MRKLYCRDGGEGIHVCLDEDPFFDTMYPCVERPTYMHKIGGISSMAVFFFFFFLPPF